MSTSRSAFSLIEVLIVCTIIGIMAGLAAPRVRATIDSFAVQRASREIVAAFVAARLAAQHGTGAEVRLDTLTLTVLAGGKALAVHDIAKAHGVRMKSSTALVRYAATGLGVGLSNGTITLSRGGSADTIVVARLGRIRH
ncbi:MAG TPA: type II secretion system protein [Gemmatimonadaceae bacterium]|nr:type II secretion system protein [Gemmatimonadaceae bacterium]